MPTATLAKPPDVDGPSPSRSYRLTAPNTETSPKVARDMVAGLLAATGNHTLIDLARLLVSEVVTNVFVHTTVPFVHVEAAVDGGLLIVNVTDNDPRPLPAEVPDVRDEDEGGRGLCLVRQLAHRSGVTVGGGSRPANKTVWFELRDH